MPEGIKNILLMILIAFAVRGLFAFVKHDLSKWVWFDKD